MSLRASFAFLNTMSQILFFFSKLWRVRLLDPKLEDFCNHSIGWCDLQEFSVNIE